MTFKSKSRKRLVLILKIVLWLVALTALVLGFRWLWLKWRAFGGFLIPWWRETIADPILSFMLRAFIAVDGDVLSALGIIAIATWLLSKLAGFSLIKWGAGHMAKQQYFAFERAIPSAEDIHARFRKLYGDDVEKIAFYETRLETPKKTGTIGRHQLAGCVGCIGGLMYMAIMTPVVIVIGVAIFHGVLGLFGGRAEPAHLLAAAGPKAQTLETYLPLATQFMDIDLQGRGFFLIIVYLLICLLYWISQNISPSGRTITHPSPWWLWTHVPITAVLCYLLLNGALILFSCIYFAIILVETVWKRLVWPQIYLPLRARLYLSREQNSRSG